MTFLIPQQGNLVVTTARIKEEVKKNKQTIKKDMKSNQLYRLRTLYIKEYKKYRPVKSGSRLMRHLRPVVPHSALVQTLAEHY